VAGRGIVLYPGWPWMAAAPVKAPESLAESQMRQLDNQVLDC
jgi:hypothetical protein